MFRFYKLDNNQLKKLEPRNRYCAGLLIEKIKADDMTDHRYLTSDYLEKPFFKDYVALKN